LKEKEGGENSRKFFKKMVVNTGKLLELEKNDRKKL